MRADPAGLKGLAEASGLCTAPRVPPCLGKQLLSRPQGPHLPSIWSLSALNCFKLCLQMNFYLGGNKGSPVHIVSSGYRYWGAMEGSRAEEELEERPSLGILASPSLAFQVLCLHRAPNANCLHPVSQAWGGLAVLDPRPPEDSTPGQKAIWRGPQWNLCGRGWGFGMEQFHSTPGEVDEGRGARGGRGSVDKTPGPFVTRAGVEHLLPGPEIPDPPREPHLAQRVLAG